MNTGWETFWYVVICTAITAYFGLGVILVVGGFFDVRKMFRRLEDAHKLASRDT